MSTVRPRPDVGTRSPPTARVVGVLDLLAESAGALTSASVARRLALSTSTTASVLAGLEDAGYVTRAADKTYSLGPAVWRLVGRLAEQSPMLAFARDELSRLAARWECGCALSRIGDDRLDVMMAVGTTDALGTRPGQRFPLDPPHGDFAMAWRTADEIDEWLSRSAHPLDDEGTTQRRRVLAGIRRRGYAVYSIESETRALSVRMRELLQMAVGDEALRSLREPLTQLASMIGRYAYSGDELRRRPTLAVSYVIAPVFGPDAQPRYEVALHLLRDSIRREDVVTIVDDLLQVTRSLTAMIGGHAPP